MKLPTSDRSTSRLKTAIRSGASNVNGNGSDEKKKNTGKLNIEDLKAGDAPEKPETKQEPDTDEATEEAEDPIQPFYADELARIEEKTLEFFPRWYALFMCLSRTGMRIGEVRALRWENVSFKSRQIHVCWNHPSGRQLTTVKTRAGDRRIDMTGDLVEALLQWKKDLRAERLAKGKTDLPKLVFCNTQANPFDYSNFLKPVLEPRPVKGVGRREKSASAPPHICQSVDHGRSSVDESRLSSRTFQSRVTLEYYSHFIPSEAAQDLSEILDASASKTQTKRKRLRSESKKQAE